MGVVHGLGFSVGWSTCDQTPSRTLAVKGLIDGIACGVKEHTQRTEINLRALRQADLQMITFSEMMMTIIMIMTMMNLK